VTVAGYWVLAGSVPIVSVVTRGSDLGEGRPGIPPRLERWVHRYRDF
jgi:hypothetical protein